METSLSNIKEDSNYKHEIIIHLIIQIQLHVF